MLFRLGTFKIIEVAIYELNLKDVFVFNKSAFF